ncbi:hypothetical protein [Gracilimonas sp.]|uniref:hypothetical protein n=1 Tax=Gracilimonas sp. TaxID=1974203 RepID=UPI0032ED26EF
MTIVFVRDINILIVIFLLVSGCSGFKNGLKPDIDQKKVFLTTQGYNFENQTGFFSEVSEQKVNETLAVDSVSKLILNQLIISYPKLTRYEITDDSASADLIVTVSKIRLRRRIYSINFLHIGPLYDMKIEVNIREKDGRLYTYTARSIANMAWENFSHKVAYWMNREEKRNTEYQYHNYIVALRRAYYNLYIHLFRYKPHINEAIIHHSPRRDGQ